MLPTQVPQPKNWTDRDRWICVARYLEALSHALFDWCEQRPQTGIPWGEKGDPCFDCPAGDRCPAWCDETHWKRYTEFYAFENFKIVEQYSNIQMTVIDDILKEINDANTTKDTSQS